MEDEKKSEDLLKDSGDKSRKYRMAREGYWSVWAVASVLLTFAMTMFSEEAERLHIDGDWWLVAILVGMGLTQNLYGLKNLVGKKILSGYALARAKVAGKDAKKDA